MNAAIYARKSTEQTGADADAKSVERQIENARAFAASKGWRVAGRARLRRRCHQRRRDAEAGQPAAAARGHRRRPPAVPDPDRARRIAVQSSRRRRGLRRVEAHRAGRDRGLVLSGRDAVQVRHLRRQRRRIRAGRDERGISAPDREVDARGDGPKGEGRPRHRRPRVRVRQRLLQLRPRDPAWEDALLPGPHRQADQRGAGRGRASHLRALRRWYRLRAHRETVERRACAAPRRPQQARPAGWSPSTVYEVLHRPLYRGEVVWNKTTKRDAEGKTAPTARPEAEWLRHRPSRACASCRDEGVAGRAPTHRRRARGVRARDGRSAPPSRATATRSTCYRGSGAARICSGELARADVGRTGSGARSSMRARHTTIADQKSASTSSNGRWTRSTTKS